jgi:hypothetical protein
MPEMTAFQRKLLMEIYRLKGRQRVINVDRSPGNSPVVLSVGGKRWDSNRAMDALSELYSRGLVYQEKLNCFALTDSGLEVARHLARN